jgi:uncharacterized protein (DUF433 family)
MNAGVVTLEIPAGLYARLQSLAAELKTEPAQVVERLVNTNAQPVADAIIRDPLLRGGRPIIAETGTTVRTVAGLYKLGLSAEDIAGELPLTLAQVYTALTYYHTHTQEIEADIQADSEERVMREFEQPQ